MGKEMVIVRNTENLEKWQNQISECRNSGKTVVEWCAERNISVKTYYYWHRKLAQLQCETDRSPSFPFYEIHGYTRERPEIAVTLRIGICQAEIYAGADPETIQAVCRAMKTC